jgi:hypothetical protein
VIEYRKSSVRAANPGRRLNAFAVQRIITAYTLAFGGLLLGGRVSDRLGSHKALLNRGDRLRRVLGAGTCLSYVTSIGRLGVSTPHTLHRTL